MSIFSKLFPKANPEQPFVAPVVEERRQVEVQEMDTDAIRNNYLMRDYMASLSPEEKQAMAEAQNADPKIQEYKANVGLDKQQGESPILDPASLPKPPKPNNDIQTEDKSSIFGPHSLTRERQ